MFSEVGSYDAKTKLPELLREVERGQRFTITHRGRPVADLVSTENGTTQTCRAAIAALREVKRVVGVDAADVHTWIIEGRR